MIKRSLLSIVVLFSTSFSLCNHVAIPKTSVFIPDSMADSGSLDVYKTKNGFRVLKDGVKHKVNKYDVDPLLKKMDDTQLEKFLANGYLHLKQNDAGEYSIDAKVRGLGGGAGGATAGFYVGKFTVHFLAHGTIALIALATGPAAPVTAASLEATFLPAIEAASNIGGIAGGIVGGVATGPM